MRSITNLVSFKDAIFCNTNLKIPASLKLDKCLKVI